MPSKAVKIAEGVYYDLLDLQRPRETISQVIGRLVRIGKSLKEAVDLQQETSARDKVQIWGE